MSLKKLGRYELVRVLGKGAMGIVYEGRDPNLDRRVAIKTVKVENLSEEAATEYEHRFRTEARSAARLQHPNIVSVYDSDRDGDIAYLVMEYIQGDDLKHHLDRGARYTLEQSLKMIRDLLSALDYAHKQGIVHRDVKPANLLIEPGGRVKLTDFGVARIQDSGEATRTQGSMVGTLKYMAPEQVQGQKIDSRADLFSVGVVLYQLLTDKRPFDGDNDFSIIHQIIGHHPPPPSTINDKLPTALDAVVARALAKNREERFATARDFASALQSAIRRAEDQTVVPPLNPLKKADGGGTLPGLRSQGAAATSPPTVTQEVELVYWKDIKDSTDPQEFEAFLVKFPAGIYADLARKRIRKLQGGAPAPDQTMLSGVAAGAAPASAGELADAEVTRARTDTTPLGPARAPALPQAQVAAAGAAEPTAPDSQAARDSASDFPSTITLVRPAAPESSPAPAPAPRPLPEPAPPPAASEPAKLANAPAPEPKRSRRQAGRAAAKPLPAAMLGGVATVVVAGLLAFFMMGEETDGAPQAAAPVPAAAPPARSAPAAPVPAAVVTPTEMPSEPKPSVAARARSTARPAHPKPKEPGVAQSAPPRATPAPAHARAEFAAVDACRDKVFVAREFCLAEGCSKPGARSHPLCLQWRAEKRMRENSRIGN